MDKVANMSQSSTIIALDLLVISPSSHMKRVEHIWQGLGKMSPICQQNSDASEDALKWFPDSQNDSFPNMYDILEAKVDRLVGKSILAKKNT